MGGRDLALKKMIQRLKDADIRITAQGLSSSVQNSLRPCEQISLREAEKRGAKAINYEGL